MVRELDSLSSLYLSRPLPSLPPRLQPTERDVPRLQPTGRDAPRLQPTERDDNCSKRDSPTVFITDRWGRDLIRIHSTYGIKLP